MQNIIEPIFEIAYLICVIILGFLTLKHSNGRRQFKLFGIMAIILGVGDAFHLIPRIYAVWTDGLENHVKALGVGKAITSISMTVFYVLLYHVWKERYNKKSQPGLSCLVYVLAIIRVGLCFLPQNMWLSDDPPLSWGIYRNIPFLILAIVIIVLYFKKAKTNNDKAFRFMWLAIILSFLFYIPVVLFAGSIPAIGMLMIPKTCAYIWIVWMGYSDARKTKLKIN